MPRQPIDRLRDICLALPEGEEKEAWGDPTFRVRGKIFAMEKRGDGRVSLWCKAELGSQMVLVGADPKRFFVPPYVGHKGWVGMRLDDNPDWDEVIELVKRSYRLIAPKRLAALLTPEAERERVFTPFHRLAGTHATGAGLGLSLVRQIARLHGGGASVISVAEGRGCFRVVLPAAGG
jgi:predicted DNA-binding protein (MmcQ/YjbR family)